MIFLFKQNNIFTFSNLSFELLTLSNFIMSSLSKVQVSKPNYQSGSNRIKPEQVREVETASQQENKANSWAAKITQKVSPEVVAKMKSDEQRIKAENADKLAKKIQEQKMEQQRKREEYERNYDSNMQRKHGLKKPFVVPPIGYWAEEEVLPIGALWEFKVEGSRDESEFAKSRRKDPENQRKLCAYLAEKYGRNWIEASEDGEDDCPYLRELREKERRKQEEEEWEREERQREQLKEIKKEMEEKEKEREEMERKLRSGEITRKAYNLWVQECEEEEWEDQENYHIEGLRLWEATERVAMSDAAWRARNATR